MTGEIINFLDRYTKSGKPVKDLSRFRGLMDKLGNPQDSLKFVHIAGTNGKGSVTRMLASSLSYAGYKTGEFTSPYIFRYNDRMKINGEEIPDRELEELIRIVEPAALSGGEDYSQFEITNAIAFMWFAMKKCDIVVLETGMGGLNDSTNIICDNVCSVITSVSLDHTAVLGNTLGEIAVQKAGIIKDGCPVVLSPYNKPEVENIVSMRAAVLGSRFVVPDVSKIKVEHSDWKGTAFIYKLREYFTPMAGIHQVSNAVTAIEAVEFIRKKYPKLTDKCVFEGITKAVMPSRCQVVRKSAPMVIIDGAHNPDGMRVLSDFVLTLGSRPKIMICGMSADKDWKSALSYIAPLIDKAYCVDGFTKNTVFAPKLCECFANAECASLTNVYFKAVSAAGDKGVVIIGGSLYLPSAINRFSS
ncbi:MAG: bifunctional folylpolyglutamate synthase/dihydrofolate synthase [Huintestinicola sp.]